MVAKLEDLFHSQEVGRGAFLSRLFAFFSEEVCRAWCACDAAPFMNLGRPTIGAASGTRGHTLDFTLRHRATGRTYVAEMKCEIQFENYRYLRLIRPDQLDHHSGAAFCAFLDIATDSGAHPVTVGGAPVAVDGAILVWGCVTPEGVAATKDRYGFADVLDVESMLAQLAEWRPAAWANYVETRRRWVDELFDALAYAGAGTEASGR
ncbi:MAG: hypothetical protein ACRDZR_01300 [Acidimicrobiales bacterium]